MNVVAPTHSADAPTPVRLGQSRALSVWRWHFVLAAAALTIAASFAVLHPAAFTRPLYLTGTILFLALSIVVMVVPWDGIARTWSVTVPLADVFVIGLMWAGNETTSLGLLLVFPLAWVATAFNGRWLALALVESAGVLVVASIIGASTIDALLRLVVIGTTLAFISVALHLGSRRSRAVEALLKHQTRQLDHLLADVRVQDERNANLLDSLPSGVARIDATGAVVTSNSAYREMYGLGTGPGYPATAVEYRTRRGEAIPQAQTTLARAKRREAVDSEIVWLFDAQGKWRALEVTIRSAADVPGGVDSSPLEADMVIVVTDVTSVTMAEGSRATLARAISHELRNPLTAVLGYADLLRERTDLPASAREQVRNVSVAAERMERLLGSNLARIDPAEVASSTFDLAVIIANSANAFIPAAAHANVTIEVRRLGVLPVDGDEFRIRQVLDNVLSNAVKYTPRGGRITIEAVSDDRTCGVSVSDTGIGIDEEDLPHIFEPYFRASTAARSQIDGTGIGMSIAQQIVTDNGGRISASSVVGGGTRIDIRFTAAGHPPASTARPLEAAR